MPRLSVNLNKIALLRNSRRTGVPDVLRFGRIAHDAGAIVHVTRDWILAPNLSNLRSRGTMGVRSGTLAWTTVPAPGAERT